MNNATKNFTESLSLRGRRKTNSPMTIEGRLVIFECASRTTIYLVCHLASWRAIKRQLWCSWRDFFPLQGSIYVISSPNIVSAFGEIKSKCISEASRFNQVLSWRLQKWKVLLITDLKTSCCEISPWEWNPHCLQPLSGSIRNVQTVGQIRFPLPLAIDSLTFSMCCECGLFECEACVFFSLCCWL